MRKRLFMLGSLLLVSLFAVIVFGPSANMADAADYIILNFDGLSRDLAQPVDVTETPDMSGDVGLNLYIQSVNLQISAYNKMDGIQLAQIDTDAFFTGIVGAGSTACSTPANLIGQPQVLFDQMSGRWLITASAFEDIDSGPYYQCIAVSSQTLDPLDATIFTDLPTYWSQYAFEIHDQYMHDLPKFGVWPDGFYMATDLYDVWNNGLHRTPKGVTVWVFNRDDLVTGVVAPRTQNKHISESSGYSGLLPSDLLGDPPPAGTPNYFAAVAPPNQFLTWEFHVDWINTANTAFTGPITTNVSNFTWPVGYLAPQLGNAEQLDIQGQRLMQPLHYSIVDGVPALWATHTVGQDDGTTGIRWYELRNVAAGSTPTTYQQGTYIDPEDGTYRWLGSIAVDGQGNMAMAYSASDGDMYPEIRQTGRLVDDPLGVLMPEDVFISSSGPQDYTGITDGPWGQYSHMTVDPYDRCHFWYTNQYYDAGSVTEWRTRITKFSLVECDTINQGVIVRVSLHTDNTEAINGGSGIYDTAVDATGRYVVFDSEADNLVDDDTAGHVDVFLRDRDADGNGIYDEPGGVTTTRISTGFAGDEANGDSGSGIDGVLGGSSVDISADANFIVYASEANNIVSGDTNGTWDVFVYDRINDVTERVSVNSGGTQGNAPSDQPVISYDGRYVAFRSSAANLVAGDTNLVSDIFLRDRLLNTTIRVSVDSVGTQADGASFTPAISPGFDDITNGLYIVYASDATNLAAGDANALTDIFAYDRVTLVTSRISVDAGAVDADGRSYQPTVSTLGIVAFASDATDLVVGDTNLASDIFIRSIVAGPTTRVSVTETGLESNGDSFQPSISHDGSHVAFESEASNFLSGDLNGLRDVYLKNILTGEVRRATFGYDGSEANGATFWPDLNADGQHVVYASDSNNLVNDDGNNLRDVFAWNRDGVLPLGPLLSIPQGTPEMQVAAGQAIEIPVLFTSNSHNISSLSFSLDVSNPCLTFDPVDANNDGFLDNVRFNAGLPAFNYSTAYLAPTQILQLSTFDPVLPLSSLPDTPLFYVTLTATCQPPGQSRSN